MTTKRVMQLMVRLEWWDSDPPTPSSGNWNATVDTQEQIQTIFDEWVDRQPAPAPPGEGALAITVTGCIEILRERMLLAVFGHYDSRGGTTAVPIADASEASIASAKQRYDNHYFEWDREIEAAKEAKAAGTPWSWDPETSPRPSESDFMFVAELHYAPYADLGGDLTEGDRDVLIDAPPIDAETRTVNAPAMGTPEEWKPGDPPVQLELVTAGGAAVMLSSPQTTRWDDDAFGFVILGLNEGETE